MSLFSTKRKFKVTPPDPQYTVQYLGNVQTSTMRGDGCVDRPTQILWNNYTKNRGQAIEMKLSVSAAGLIARTREQGVTEYRAHRISYCVAHPDFPKLFVWVYRHEGKRMKVELRCHAVLCRTDAKAKALAIQLHDKLATALNEFMRQKTRRQTSRLTLQRTSSLPPCIMNTGAPKRTMFLQTGQNFKPTVDKSLSAPKLGSICEDREEEALATQEPHTLVFDANLCKLRHRSDVVKLIIDEASDDESSESGFSEQDTRDGGPVADEYEDVSVDFHLEPMPETSDDCQIAPL